MRSLVALDRESDPSACKKGSPRCEYICHSLNAFASPVAGIEPVSASEVDMVLRKALNA